MTDRKHDYLDPVACLRDILFVYENTLSPEGQLVIRAKEIVARAKHPWWRRWRRSTR